MNHNPVTEPLVTYMKANQPSRSALVLEDALEDPGIFQDSLLMNEFSEGGIPYSLFEKIQEAGPLTLQEWADILGLSSKTLTRYRKEGKVFQPWHSSVILQMTEVLSAGMEVFGDRSKLYQWLTNDTFALGSRSPKSLLTNSYGRELVLREMVHIEHGIFA